MLPSILVIEDDADLQKYLQQVLRENNYSVKSATDGITGLELIDNSNPDLVILDLNLPDLDGESVCGQIRKSYPMIPIIMLTAKDSVSDKVKGLVSGADDYVTKPFNTDELLARVKTRLRSAQVDNSLLKVGDLVMDTRKVEVKRANQSIQLTPQEFKLLEYLMMNTGTVLTRDMILNRIWLSSPDVETRVVDVYMGYLRKKIDSGYKKKLLHSIRGFGYTIKE
jgi:DNA-binding response OmpR family regulator